MFCIYREKSFTFVPMSKGNFMAAQNAKWVLVSAAVKTPFPTSSISASLCPQKSTALRRKLFSFKIWAMPDHFAVQKFESSAIPSSG
jgi:hypothetical protein